LSFENLYIGVDIEKISKFEHLDLQKDSNFLKKIFTDNELNYAFSKKNFAQSLTVRYACKEAIIKALTGFNITNIVYNEIEISLKENNFPCVDILTKNTLPLEIRVSLSHNDEYAISFVLMWKNMK